ncbi:MAG TPA: response regulator [Oligoflexia bacterium]|nr:response regulator [Oligoflexia bacterium]HMP48485.1 response regulator [Oligoflexia bacterium]
MSTNLNFQNMRILITESDATRQRQLRTILTSLGHKSADIETASDSKSALSMIRKKRYDVAFFCHEGSSFNGLELIRELRGGTSKSLPIVLFSPNMSREILLEANQVGANGFLSYPFSVSDVEDALTTALRRAL